jgi:hypothetical protein
LEFEEKIRKEKRPKQIEDLRKQIPNTPGMKRERQGKWDKTDL